VTDDKPEGMEDYSVRKGRFGRDNGPFVYMVDEKSKKTKKAEDIKLLKNYIDDNFTAAEKAQLKKPSYFYEVTFNKPGDMLMPILVRLTFEDGTTEDYKFPVQIWRKNNQTAARVFATEKQVKKIEVDPELLTADIDVTNNSWPKEEVQSKFDQFEGK